MWIIFCDFVKSAIVKNEFNLYFSLRYYLTIKIKTMSIKQSLLDNKDEILGNLPTQELKDAFLADLEKAEEVVKPSVDELLKEATAPEHVAEELYDGIKAELEAAPKAVRMTAEEEKAAIEEALKNPPSSGAENEGE